jgi:peptide deformylase
MAVLNIRTYPDEVLKRKAETVEAVDDELRLLMDNMAETMYAAPGIGLAAPQVGVSKRIIVLDVSTPEEKAPLLQLANPEVVEAYGEVQIEEGCLSLPGFLSSVKRFSEVTVKALDRDGNPVTIEAGGLLAIALQHEIDHLEGTLILDRASMLKREFYRKKIKKSLARAG